MQRGVGPAGGPQQGQAVAVGQQAAAGRAEGQVAALGEGHAEVAPAQAPVEQAESPRVDVDEQALLGQGREVEGQPLDRARLAGRALGGAGGAGVLRACPPAVLR